MKKLSILTLAVILLTMLAACSGTPATTGTSSYADATEVLTKVWSTYADNEKFAAGGGDYDNTVMDGPGKFDVTKTEDLDAMLALPSAQAANVDDAASLIHMMNANTFTGAAYRLKDGADVTAFANDFKANLDSRRWMCGFPEKFVVIKTGNYVVTAFGNGEIVDLFKTKSTGTLENATVVLEAAIAG